MTSNKQMAKNKQLARAFRIAKTYVAGDQQYICHALLFKVVDDLPERQCKAAQSLIESRLKVPFVALFETNSCEKWLSRNIPGLTYSYLAYTDKGRLEVKAYRLRWLDSLIEEFS